MSHSNTRVNGSLSQLRAQFIAYHENPKQFIDFENIYDEYEDRVTYRRKSLQQALGVELLGQGAFGRVYSIDDRKVLKICNRDKAYDKFVDFVQSNRSPHVPRVYYRGTWANKQAYILERLQPIHESAVGEVVAGFVYNDDVPAVPKYLNPEMFGPTLLETCQKLRQFKNDCSNEIGIGWDIASRNLMQREDGTVVITDPFC